MHVLATAGHVDHGKSTLVRALSGMEPDRWAEERRRGMTIDLGYAWTTLPSGATVAFVDVPGHQRFIANMLAGLGPAPAVMFVVAADEGWRRQSTEHLAAVDALGLTRALLVVTRSDLADPGPATAEALGHLARSSLGHVPAVAVSGATGEGLPLLRSALDDLVATLPDPSPDAPVRLWVDRAFTIRGSGTVVTGTLAGGTLRTGDTLQLGDRSVRVRGLQSLGEAHASVSAVARVAVNLRGVDLDDVGRGDALLTPGAWRSTSVVDVRLSDLTTTEVVLHVGTAAVPVRVRPLDDDVFRLTLARPLPLRAGDRGVLRDPGAQSVAAGLVVLDADPPALARRGAARARALDLADADGTVQLATEVGRRGFARLSDLLALGAADDPSVPRLAGWAWSPSAWAQALARLRVAVAAAPAVEGGLTHETARQAAGLPDLALLAPLAQEAGLVLDRGRVRGAVVGLGPAEAGVAALERDLIAAPFAAPEKDRLRALGLDARALSAAERAGRLVRVGPDIVLLPHDVDRAVELLRGLPAPFTLSQARQALGTTRRVAVPLLEHLDRQGRTTWVGEVGREVS